MTTISADKAKLNLPELLAKVQEGSEFIISKNKRPIARLVPMSPQNQKKRPKVGKMTGKQFPIPDEAFAPLNENELREWGL